MASELGVATQSESEEDLVSRIAAGDRAAEAEFARQYERGVRVLMRRRCRPNDPVVDDLVQEVLSSVLQRLRAGGLRDQAALPAYVQASIVYAATAEYRQRRPTEALSVIVDFASEASPAESFSREQLAAVIRKILAEMPVVRDREILTRFYLNEDDKDRICADLGLDDGHFHRVIHRARQRLRELLALAGFDHE